MNKIKYNNIKLLNNTNLFYSTLLQIAVLLSVLQVRLLLLRRETHGRKRAANETETRAEGVRHANENAVRPRARTVLRAAGRRGRRVPEGVGPGDGRCVGVRFGVRFGVGGGRGTGSGQRQFRATAVGRFRVHVSVHRMRRGRSVPVGRRRQVVPGLRVLLLHVAQHHRLRQLAVNGRDADRHGHRLVLFRVHTVRHGADGHVLQHRTPRRVHQTQDALPAGHSADERHRRRLRRRKLCPATATRRLRRERRQYKRFDVVVTWRRLQQRRRRRRDRKVLTRETRRR